MPAYVCPPAVVAGEFSVDTADILAEVRDRHPDVPWLSRIEGIAASTGIRTRRWMRPLTEAAAVGAHGAHRRTAPPRATRWPAGASPGTTSTGSSPR